MYEPGVLDPALREHLPELRELLDQLEQMMPEGVDMATRERLDTLRQGEAAAGRAQLEQLVDSGALPRDAVEERRVPGPPGGDDVRVLILRPPRIRAVYLHLHGGGWALGSPEMNVATSWQLARATDMAVVSADYRLAPEHPFPAGPDDCDAVALWLLRNGANEFGTERLAIGGESAGGHLAALTLLRVRDRHDAIAHFEAANLVYGAFDLSLTPSQRMPQRTLVFSDRDAIDATGYFLPDHDREARRTPEVSPLFANLAFLPPALLTCGTADRLLDDTLFMSARWCAAGNRTELALYPEAPHGFTMFPCGMTHAAQARIEGFLGGIVKRG